MNLSANSLLSQGMTFNPSIDCRNDLVNHYGYTKQQVNTMSDDQIFSIMDTIQGDTEIPFVESSGNKRCSCGGQLDVIHIDCETNAYCEVYYCECLSCGNDVKFNQSSDTFEVEDIHTLEDIGLSARTYTRLTKAGYSTVQQVKGASLTDMQRVRGLGNNALSEIENKLDIKFI